MKVCPNCDHLNTGDNQFCETCLENLYPRTFNVSLSPSWVTTAKTLMPDPRRMDAKGEIRATDIMLSERAKEMKNSAKARAWEAGRRKEWKANKKYFKAESAYKEKRRIEEAVKKVLH